MKKNRFFLLFLLSLIGVLPILSAEEPTTLKKEEEFVGELFNVKVPQHNYYFVKSALIVFGNRFGAQPTTPQQEEEIIWEQLMLSFEGFRRNITVSQKEVNEEVNKILGAERVSFNREEDADAYKKWVEQKAGEPVELFENQLRHLLQIQKLRQKILDNAKVEVADKEAFQEFLTEKNSISLELIQFTGQKEARGFYKKAQADKNFWDREKERQPERFRRIGRVSLAFLIDLWKIPKQALYKMMKMRDGRIYPPEPIYKGYAVFKILEKKKADVSEYYSDSKVKEAYYKEIKRRKRFDVLGEWYKKLKEEAKIKIYKQENQEKEE